MLIALTRKKKERMGISKLVYYSFFLFFIATSFSMRSNNKCHDDQKDALLVFKQNDVCERLKDPIRMNWNPSIDCCDWVGITCNKFTGDVISLNLRCGMLQGVVELDTLLSNLPNLEVVDLSYSGLSVMTKMNGHHVHPNLFELSLAACNLTMFPDFLQEMKNLRLLDLSRNYISGDIPAWAGEIGANSLIYLDLSDNLITGIPEFMSNVLQYMYLQSSKIQGPFPPWICHKKQVKYLDMSKHSISGMVPQCLQNISSSLVSLNVNSNIMHGPFPMAVCNMGNLMYLDISDNGVTGIVPQCLQNISSSLVSLNVQSNMIHGTLPMAICNMSRLLYLEMSNNNFHGMIPHCFGNVISSLAMINLGNNILNGSIPRVNGSCELLDMLRLHGNKLEGEMPSFLQKCGSLKILDLGNNQLNGTFPHWLGYLPKLQILVLRSNSLHGIIETPSTSNFLFPSLCIFDIAHNRFEGRIPEKYFENFNVIKDVEKSPKPEFVNISGSNYYSIIPLKGPQFSSLMSFNVIDLSGNRFEGEIPNVIGNLKSLMMLNLSNNNLSGEIPHVLGNLFDMEVLDLSRNQLVGEIPQSLENLSFLVLLNLSQNHLVGHIPENRQFLTFTSDSYLGNPGLCGPPLLRECKDLSSPQVKAKWICMEAVLLGLGCGTLVGVVWGYRMLSTGTPKWLTAIANAGGHITRNKRKHVKRN